MGGFRNTVIYSKSRDQLLRDCARRYYYQVYVMWGGWWNRGKRPKSERAEEAYVAKFAMTVPMWMGKLVHEQAEWALKEALKGRVLRPHEAKDLMLQRASSSISIGLKQALEQRSGNPKTRIQLIEAMVGGDIDEQGIRDSVDAKIRTLCSSDDNWDGMMVRKNLFFRALERRSRIVSVENSTNFKVDGIDVWVVLDLMMRASSSASRQCVIVDWKTGQRRVADDGQVDTYSAYAYSMGWQGVSTVLAYIGDGRVDVVMDSVDKGLAMRSISEKVTHFMESLSSRLVGGDIDDNRPIEAEFKPTTEAWKCATCPFQLMCERDGTKPKS